jgi:hypothetical protein
VFVKQPGAITLELPVPTFKASTNNNMKDNQELQAECYSTTKDYPEIS